MKRFTGVVGSVAIAIAAIFATAQQAVAQVTATGTIEIVVQDPAGLPLPGVTVSAQAADAVTRREAVTDDQGRAVLVGLAPSSQYVVNAQLSGFAPAATRTCSCARGRPRPSRSD